MKRKPSKKADAVLSHAAASRRKFTKKLVSAAFAMPAMMSFGLDDVTFAATSGAQSSFTGSTLPTLTDGVFPTFMSSARQAQSSPALRFYCVAEDPRLRVTAFPLPTSSLWWPQ
jgi:hypothetical protein